MRDPLLSDIRVKIDAAEPWADGFRRALRFWNTVLAANLHEETNLTICSVRISDGDPDTLGHGVAARSQITDRANFTAKIAVNQVAAKDMNSAEIYATAVHEIGHLLGLKHNSDIHSVMYFLDVDGTGVLDGKDILDLSKHHELRSAIFANGFIPIQPSPTEIASMPDAAPLKLNSGVGSTANAHQQSTLVAEHTSKGRSSRR